MSAEARRRANLGVAGCVVTAAVTMAAQRTTDGVPSRHRRAAPFTRLGWAFGRSAHERSGSPNGMRKTWVKALGRAAVMVALVVSMVTVSPAAAMRWWLPPTVTDSPRGTPGPPETRGIPPARSPRSPRPARSWVRLPLDWGIVGIGPGEYNWGYFDSLVNAASANGLRVLGLISNTPFWARTEGAQLLFPSSPPKNNGRVRRLRRRRGRAATPAGSTPGRSGTSRTCRCSWASPTTRRSATPSMLKAAYPAIKGANPGATVVAAGLSPLGGPDSPRDSCSSSTPRAPRAPSTRPPRTLCLPGWSGRRQQQRLVRCAAHARRDGGQRRRRQEDLARPRWARPPATSPATV